MERRSVRNGYDAIYVFTGQKYGLIQYLDHIEIHSGFKLFSVNAGYCKSCIGTNWYYVIAKNSKDARAKLKAILPYFDIYAVKEVLDESEINDVTMNPCKYIVF